MPENVVRSGGGGKKKPKYLLEEEAPAAGKKAGKEKPKNNHTYHPAPETLPGFPKAKKVKRKNQRKRWEDEDGNIYEWDYENGKVEVFGKGGRKGSHKGEFDPETGEPTKPADPDRSTDN